MKICKSYKEFRKIIRKYIPRYYRTKKSALRLQQWFINHSWDWVTYKILTIDEAQRIIKTCTSKNLPLILPTFISNKGKAVCYPISGTLEGVELSVMGYYYIIQDETGKYTVIPCGAKLIFV